MKDSGEKKKWEKNIESENDPLPGTEITTEIKCNLVAEFVGMPLLFCPIFHCHNTLCFGLTCLLTVDLKISSSHNEYWCSIQGIPGNEHKDLLFT